MFLPDYVKVIFFLLRFYL